jgi:hypothetical protein
MPRGRRRELTASKHARPAAAHRWARALLGRPTDPGAGPQLLRAKQRARGAARARFLPVTAPHRFPAVAARADVDGSSTDPRRARHSNPTRPAAIKAAPMPPGATASH